MSKKKLSVNTPSGAWLSMQENLLLVDTLMQGTNAMRAAGEKYLPREPKESLQAYRNRLARSVLYNAFADTVQKLIGKPFSKPVTIEPNTPQQINDWSYNIDRCGSNITTFAREVFQNGLVDGLTHILVDFPKGSGEPRTLADEQTGQTHPYCVNIRAQDLFAWSYKTVNGVKELTQIRINETATEPDGEWGERLLQRIRVIQPDSYKLYELRDKEWGIVVSGELSLGRIPLVTFYTNKTGFMTARPSLLDLAHLNVQHWQSSSDQEHILHFIRFPLLHGAGFNQDQKEIEVGPNRMILSEDPHAKLSYVEHSGKAVEAGRQSLRDLEEKMDAMGAQLLVQRSGDASATAASLDTAKSHSALQDMVRRLENSFEQVFELMGLWANIRADSYGGIDVNEDFGLSLITGKDEDTLLRSRMAGEISRETYLTEMKRRSVLRDDLDVQEEIDRVQTEGPAPTNAAANG